jgi:hypothetical protein
LHRRQLVINTSATHNDTYFHSLIILPSPPIGFITFSNK